MLAADDLLKALSEQESREDYRGDYNDYDFCKVLKDIGNNDNSAKTHKIKCADGTEK